MCRLGLVRRRTGYIRPYQHLRPGERGHEGGDAAASTSSAERVEVRPAVHPPLQQLEPTRHLPLHRSVAPGQRRGGTYRRVVPLKHGGESLEKTTLRNLQPAVQRTGIKLPRCAPELGSALAHRLDLRIAGEPPLRWLTLARPMKDCGPDGHPCFLTDEGLLQRRGVEEPWPGSENLICTNGHWSSRKQWRSARSSSKAATRPLTTKLTLVSAPRASRWRTTPSTSGTATRSGATRSTRGA